MNIQELEQLKELFLNKTDNKDCIYVTPITGFVGITSQGYFLYSDDKNDSFRIAALQVMYMDKACNGYCNIYLYENSYECHDLNSAIKIINDIPFVSYQKPKLCQKN